MSFSWRLIFAPPLAMDYVIAHEVAHLKVMDHSQRFWTQCEKLSDDFDFGYDWMQKNGHSLMRFGQDS
jgi:predicted metal-dependent hydrolase